MAFSTPAASATGMAANEDEWPDIQDRMTDAMIRLEDAIGPHLRELPV